MRYLPLGPRLIRPSDRRNFWNLSIIPVMKKLPIPEVSGVQCNAKSLWHAS